METSPVVRRLAAAAVAALAFLPSLALADASSSPPCTVSLGEPVMLRSSDFDPDVLVWDTRQHVIEYTSGGVHTATDVYSHTVLSKSGTRAIVVACLAASAKTRYSSDLLDAVGVKIVTGPQRGRYGWVTSDDVRASHTAQTSTAANP